MKELKRIVDFSIVLCLSISMLLSGCKDSVEVSTMSSEERYGTESTALSIESTEQTINSSDGTKDAIVLTDDFYVNILSSDKGGDSTILKYGNTEILIDTALGDATLNAVDEVIKYDEDHTWEYVIFTHPDSDHIGKATELFDMFSSNGWQVEHLIDFGIELEEDQESYEEKKVLRDYKNVIKGLENIDYYSPNGDLSLTKLTKEYVIDSNIVLSVLYNEDSSSGKDNEQSVCCLFQVGSQKLLFTGDLEEKGENDLLRNHRQLLKNVTFFKAGHHGSTSSNTQSFVDWIRPAYVGITYNSKVNEEDYLETIEKFLKYTDYIYPTWVKDDEGGADPLLLFGECQFVFDGKSVIVNSEFSQDNTLKQVDNRGGSWYWRQVKAKKISDEIDAYFLDENIVEGDDGKVITYEKSGNLAYFNCTLVKYGHYDILIDCGSLDIDSKVLVDKLKDYVVDGVIECVVVSHYHLSNYSQLVGSSLSDNECVFNCFEIEKIVDNDSSMTNCSNTSGTAYSMYLSRVLSIPERISLSGDESSEQVICDDLRLNVYRGNNSKQQANEDDYSLVSVVDFNGRQMVFPGDLTNYSWFCDNYSPKLKNVLLIRFPSSYVEFAKMKDIDAFLKITKPDVLVLGSPVNHWNNGQYFVKRDSTPRLIDKVINDSGNNALSIYSCGYVENNENKSVLGDIDYTLFSETVIIGGQEYNSYVSCCLAGGSHEPSIIDNSYYFYEADDLRTVLKDK